jgi:hypothetical protein
VINNDAAESIFKSNVNPLRLGLMLIKTVDDINVHYGYSKSTVDKMKEQIEEQLVSVLDTYSNPSDILQLMKLPDYEGRDCFWYF